MPSWSSLYLDWSMGMTDYIARHVVNYSRIQYCLDYLHAITGGARGLLDVPLGLQQIFDRKGIIGKDSYEPPAGTKTATAYNLVIPLGAYWSGSTFLYKTTSTTISLAGYPTGDYVINLDGTGNPMVSDTATADCIWRFHWNASTHKVEDVVRDSGVKILFDGDDYQSCLYSTALAVGFESIGERFENIEANVSMLTHLQVDPECIMTGDSLDWRWYVGRVRNDNQVWIVIPDSDVNLTPGVPGVSKTNYIEVDPNTGDVSANIVGFTAGSIPLYIATCDTVQITGYTDKRAWLSAGTGGGGGSHTANTDVGTTSPQFKLNMNEAGVPSVNGMFAIERGTSPDVAIRWNETTDKWQYTEDGTNWSNLGEMGLDLGAQAISKFVAIDAPSKVFENLSRGSSVEFEEIDLTSYLIDAPNGVDAVVLRVIFWDTQTPLTPTPQVSFRKGGIGGFANIGYTLYSPAQQDWSRPQTLMVGASTDYKVEFSIDASGASTANLRVYLTGYYKKIIGVGTQEVTFVNSDMIVAANTTVDSNLPLFANRGLVHYLKVEETGGLVTGEYDIEFYDKDTFDADGLLYKAQGMLPTEDYIDELPWWHKDVDGTSEIHIRIVNKDLTQQGTFAITLKCEMFA